MKTKILLSLLTISLFAPGTGLASSLSNWQNIFVAQAQAQTPRDLIAQIDPMIDALTVNRGNKNALHKHTRNILRSLDRRNVTAACDQIQGMIDQLFGWVRGRQLTTAQVASILDNLLGAQGDLNCPTEEEEPTPSPSPSPAMSPTPSTSPSPSPSPAG